MNMLGIVFRSSFEEEMLHLLKTLDVKALTEAPSAVHASDLENRATMLAMTKLPPG